MISETLKHIPWYVYLILYFVLVRGIKALKDQVVDLKKVLILPLLMNIWVVVEIQEMFGFEHISVLLKCLLSTILGTILGWRLIRGQVAWVDNGVLLRGSPVTLILVLSIFVAKFTIFTWSGFHPELWSYAWFATGVIMIFGGIAGISLGRLAYIMSIIKTKGDGYLA